MPRRADGRKGVRMRENNFVLLTSPDTKLRHITRRKWTVLRNQQLTAYRQSSTCD